MCSTCQAAVASMTAAGATEDEAIGWLWDEQVAEFVAAAETRTT